MYECALREEGYNAIVTCGGVHSNHNRAMALMAMANGWKCHLVYHGKKAEFLKSRGNADLVKMSGATFEFVDSESISTAMDNAMISFKRQGLKPYYVHGGGHDLPGGKAFVEAMKELKNQCLLIDYKPDYIFVASGTGSMQAGMAVGLDVIGWSDVKLMGFSIARPLERGKRVVVDFANLLAPYYGINGKGYDNSISFNCDYIGKGYDKHDVNEKAFIRQIRKTTGLLLDETYTGKAMYGMMDYIKKNKIEGKVLFWLTGGPLNVKL